MTIDMRDIHLFDAIRDWLLQIEPVASHLETDDGLRVFYELEKCIAVLSQEANIRWYWLEGGHSDIQERGEE